MTPKKKSYKKKKKKTTVTPDVLWLRRFTLTIAGISLFLIGGAILFVTTFRGGSSGVSVEVALDTTTIARGVPFEVQVNINNQTGGMLSDTRLSLRFSDGLVNLSLVGDTQLLTDTFGDMGEGSFTKRTYTLLPISAIKSAEQIIATFSYKLGRARFETRTVHDITIDTEALKVSIETPEQILSGTASEFTITYANVSDFDFPLLELRVSYPPSFTFISADLQPDISQNTWRLGALRAGSEGMLTIRGIVNAADDDTPELHAVFSVRFIEATYDIAEVTKTLITAESPLGFRLFTNGAVDGVARLGNILTYSFTYHNRSGIALRNVVINAELVGSMFNLGSLVTNARTNVRGDTLVWDSTSVPALELLEPGAQGVVNFTVGIQRTFPIGRLGDKNFLLRVTADITSPSVPYYLDAERLVTITRSEIKIAGRAELETEVFYRDASSGMLNDGIVPPRIGVATQYTIHWIIRNYATDINNTLISAYLPENIRWTGIVKSTTDSVPLYDPEERKVVWEIDTILATKGVVTSPEEAVFQIELTPTNEFSGKFHPLISQSNLTAADAFTDITLTATSPAVDTSLPHDPTVSTEGGRVVE